MVDVAFVIEPSGDILAVMPGLAGIVGNINCCTCYGHIGQHGATHISYITDECKHAYCIEHVDLLDELIRVGYEVNVISIDRVNDDDYREMRRTELDTSGRDVSG